MQRTITILLLWFGIQTAMAYEEPDYTVLAETVEYEIRKYAEHIVAEVNVGGGMGESGNSAFRILAGYIFGNNTEEEEMNMTAPVESRRAEESGYTYAFMMERKYTLDTLPEPNDPRIRLIKRPSRIMAVRQYSGSWREANYRENAAALLEALEADKKEHSGSLVLARYDSPFTPWFMKRNEIMVELTPSDENAL